MSEEQDTATSRDVASRLEIASDPGDPSRRSFIQAGAGIVVGTAALVSAGRQLRLLRNESTQPVTGSEESHEPTYAQIDPLEALRSE